MAVVVSTVDVGAFVEKAHAVIRTRVAKLNRDRVLSPDIRAIERLIADDAFTAV